MSGNANDRFYQREYVSRSIAKVVTSDIAADTIAADKLDVLIELDGLSSNDTLALMRNRLATLQISWLAGYATHGKEIDVFLADRHVLSEQAEKRYTESVIQMPHSYLAVDLFEFGPTRAKPRAADIVYHCCQHERKLSKECVAALCEILKLVPHSLLTIRASAASRFPHSMQDKLILAPRYNSEYEHRASLLYADIALDSFPYTGATTSLELLYANVPIVTLVGEDFVERNTYSFLQTVSNMSHCIAFDVESYIAAAVELARNKSLLASTRQNLLASKQMSPLWNAKLFTKQLECVIMNI